jgi:serine protease Do
MKVRMILCLAFAAVSTLSASAQSVLDQMQQEVVTIVREARGGVVSIEDERSVVPAASHVPVNEQNPPPLKQGSPADGKGRLKPTKPLFPVTRTEKPVSDTPKGSSGPKSGTGFSIGDGYVVTTADVLEEMQNPIITSDRGERVRAMVVKMDRELNIGLLRLPEKFTVPALKLGSSSSVMPGHFAISIGNQNGQSNYAALMMVSGFKKEGSYSSNRFYPGLLQLSGTVGAGTSGAPLLNSRGEVIGMIVAVPVGDWSIVELSGGKQDDASDGSVTSGGGKAQGKARFVRPPVTSAGYALPIDELKPVIDELRYVKGFARGWIGVGLKEENRVLDDGRVVKVERTLRVQGVFPDSPAEKAGLQTGDLIESMNGKPVYTMADFRSVAIRTRQGDKLRMVIRRAAGSKTFVLDIDQRPPSVKPPTGK